MIRFGQIFVVLLIGSSLSVEASAQVPTADRSVTAGARAAVEDLSLLGRTGLRLRVLLAQAALIDIRKNQWVSDHLGSARHPTVRNYTLGVGTALVDAFVLYHSVHLLSDESRVSFYREVRRMYRAVNEANARLLAVQAELYARRGVLGPSAVPTTELAAALEFAEADVARALARRAVVDRLPWQRVARAVRMPIAFGLGVYLVADPLLTYMQVSLDPAVGEQLGDQLNEFIIDARESLAGAEDSL